MSDDRVSRYFCSYIMSVTFVNLKGHHEHKRHFKELQRIAIVVAIKVWHPQTKTYLPFSPAIYSFDYLHPQKLLGWLPGNPT